MGMFVYILKVGVIQWMECICLCQIYPLNNRCHTDGHCHCHKKGALTLWLTVSVQYCSNTVSSLGGNYLF